MPTRIVDLDASLAVPLALSGKWVAWNAEHTNIVAQAETFQQLWEAVKKKKIDDPVFEKIPRADVRFVGAL